jgi:hypothetical protein
MTSYSNEVQACMVQGGSARHLKHSDLVSIANGGEAVRYNNGRAAGSKTLQGGLHKAFRDCVKGTGSLVEQ